MALVPTDCVCSYNGFTFDPMTAVTTGLTVSPQEDATGRTVAYNKIYLRIEAHIIGQPTDSTVIAARQKLTKYGGVLVYTGRGIGPLSINTGRVRDIKFGPKPKVLSITPLGYKNACKIEWEVDVHIPECPDAKYTLGFLELSYRMENKIRIDGRLDRMVSGSLKVPNNRTAPGSDAVINSPDLYRDQIASAVPPGFRRDWNPWSLDESRTTLGFGWTDKEFGRNVYPPGVVKIDASHSFRQKGEYAFLEAVGTIKATITIDAQYDATAAMKAFFNVVVQQRLKNREKATTGISGTGRGGRDQVYTFLSFEAEEPSIFGDETVCDFSITYLCTGTSFETFLSDSGLWEPLGVEWKDWYKSVQNSALSPYGISQLVFTPSNDQIVDLCQANPQGLRPIGAMKTIQQGKLGDYLLPPIDEAGSWLRYVCNLEIETDSGTTEMRELATRPTTAPPQTTTIATMRGATPTPQELPPTMRPVAPDFAGYASLQGAAVSSNPASGRTGGSNGAGSAGTGKGNPPPADVATPKQAPGPNDTAVIQQRTRPFTAVYLVGEAIRVGFEIPPPSIGDIDGITPNPSSRLDMGEGFKTGIIGTSLTGVPIYGAKWRLRYVLPQAPTGPVIPPDPGTWLGRRLSKPQ